MRYLLDTCVISEVVRPKPNRNVLEWLADRDEESLYLSVLTIGEIQNGAAKLKDEERKNFLQRWLEHDLHARFSERILPVDEEVALTWGLIQGEAEQQGNPMPAIDGLLAATAITHDLALVTRKAQHLRPSGARILNPWLF